MCEYDWNYILFPLFIGILLTIGMFSVRDNFNELKKGALFTLIGLFFSYSAIVSSKGRITDNCNLTDVILLGKATGKTLDTWGIVTGYLITYMGLLFVIFSIRNKLKNKTR